MSALGTARVEADAAAKADATAETLLEMMFGDEVDPPRIPPHEARIAIDLFGGGAGLLNLNVPADPLEHAIEILSDDLMLLGDAAGTLGEDAGRVAVALHRQSAKAALLARMVSRRLVDWQAKRDALDDKLAAALDERDEAVRQLTAAKGAPSMASAPTVVAPKAPTRRATNGGAS